jgi:hypothetical protein
MQWSFSPGASGDCGISTAAPSHHQAPAIAAAAHANSPAQSRIANPNFTRNCSLRPD